MYWLEEITLYTIWIANFQEIAVQQNALNTKIEKNLFFIVCYGKDNLGSFAVLKSLWRL